MDPAERKAVTPKKNDPKVATRPRDMGPERGFLPSNKAAPNIRTPLNPEPRKADN